LEGRKRGKRNATKKGGRKRCNEGDYSSLRSASIEIFLSKASIDDSEGEGKRGGLQRGKKKEKG